MMSISVFLLAQDDDATFKSYQLYRAYSEISSEALAFKPQMGSEFSSLYYSNGIQHKQDSEDSKKGRSIRDVPGDLATGGKIFYSDFIHVYTEPARWDSGDLMRVGAITATGVIIFLFDQEIFDAVQRNRESFGMKQLISLGNFFEPLGHMAVQNKYFVAALGAGYIINYRPLTVLSGEILETFIFAGVPSEIIKVLVGRKRPNEGEGPYSFSFNGGQSFPSGHARNITQFAVILSHHFRFLPFQIFAYTVAVSVSFQRIESEFHWPSDVYFGALFGGWVAKTLLNYHQVKGLTITPQVSPESGYMGLDFRLVIN
jgi:membrane-associated phospholipid phosphatase